MSQSQKTTAWVLSYGEYRGWDIEGIFSSKEKAEAYVRLAGRDFNEPVEYVLDELSELEKGPTWIAYIYADGRVEHRSDDTKIRHPREHSSWEASQIAGPRWHAWVHSPISAEHAERVAVDLRQRWLRGWQTPTNDGGSVTELR